LTIQVQRSSRGSSSLARGLATSLGAINYKVRELQAEEEITVKHVTSEANTSDIFTKPLEKEAFLTHRKTLMGE